MRTMVAAALGAGKANPARSTGPAIAPIVTYAYRYKRPPQRKKAMALEVPVVVKAADPAKARKSGIVTARKPGKQHAFVPDLAEEEVQRRRDAADAMMQDFKRQIAEKIRS